MGSAAGVDYHHKYLLYTDSAGQQHTISGWTGAPSDNLPYGMMKVEANLPYDATNPDHPDSLNTEYADGSNQRQYMETIATGDDLSEKWKEMVGNAASKDQRFPYDPLRQNSNTLADSVLREAGLPAPKQDGFSGHLAPASHLKMDEKLIPKDPAQQGLSANLEAVFSAGERAKPETPTQLEERKAAYQMRNLTDSDLFKQAQAGVHKLDAGHGRAPDQRSDNAAAAIAIAARGAGMTQIDHLEVHGDNFIAAQGTPGTAQSKYVDVPVVQAMDTPMNKSAENFAQTAVKEIAPPVQQQAQQPQQHAPAAPAMAH